MGASNELAGRTSPSQPPAWLRAVVVLAFVGLAVYFGITRNMLGAVAFGLLALCALARVDRLAAVHLKDWLVLTFDLAASPTPGQYETQLPEPPLIGEVESEASA